jgi:hypothetical protein
MILIEEWPDKSQKNWKFRVEFADNYLKKGSEFWKTVLFADETNIMYLDETYVIMCGENLGKDFGKNLRPSVKYDDGAVMVCVCMAASGVEILNFIEGIMNKHVYGNILREHLKASTEKVGIQEHCAVYHDNDPKHSSHSVRQ